LIGIELLGRAPIKTPQEILELMLQPVDKVILLLLCNEQLLNHRMAGGQVAGQLGREFRGGYGGRGGRGL
jgi:hypothetical protein